MPTIEEMVNLAALIQCLVVGFSEYYDDGAQLPIMDPWVINENKWRATRYGLDAEIIIDENGNLQPLKDFIVETIDKLIKVAIGLGCREEIEKLADIVENNQAPYKRQIIQYEKNNDLTDIVKDSINGLKEGIVVKC